MVAILITCVLVIALTAYQMFIQGLFSAVIMAVLSLVSAALALNYFEPMAQWLNGFGIAAFGTQGGSLMLIFAFTLVIFREATDRLIKGNMRFPVYIDRPASAFFGLITSLTVVGIFTLGFQMLPISENIIGFNRFPDLNNLEERKSLFPGPDSFVAGVFTQFSNYSFHGSNSFDSSHPDLTAELYFDRLTIDPASRQEAAQDAITLQKAWILTEQVTDIGTGQAVTASGTLLAVRINIKKGAVDSSENRGAADPDGVIRFALGNIRLVGYEHDGPGVTVHPLGILRPGARSVDLMPLNEGKTLRASSNAAHVDLLFNWPQDINQLPPIFVQFKRFARDTLPDKKTLIESAQSAGSIDLEKTSFQGDLVEPAEAARAVYKCEKMAYIENPAAAPHRLGIPSDQAMYAGKDSENAIVVLPPDTLGTAIRRIHLAIPVPKSSEEAQSYTPLDVPNGFGLVTLEISSQSRSGADNLVPPTLVDLLGREFLPVGVVASVSASTQLIEYAYCAYSDAKSNDLLTPDRPIRRAFPSSLASMGNRGRLNKATYLYLVPRTGGPVGLIGCRGRDQASGPGYFWEFSEIEAVVVPGL